MKIRTIQRKHGKGVYNLGFNVCFDPNPFYSYLTVSLIFWTLGVQIYKPKIDVNSPEQPWNQRK